MIVVNTTPHRVRLRLGQIRASLVATNAREFVARVRKFGWKSDVAVTFDPEHGKGSHGMLHYGARATTVPDLKKELKPGLLRAMCSQIGIGLDDLRRV